jgi:transposase
MFAPSATRVYLAAGATDLRQSIDGLAARVTAVLQQDAFAPHLFAFCNRRRDKVKILFWEHNGFWLLYRRLERGTFRWPAVTAGQRALVITPRQLQWLLDGLELEERRAHPAVAARCVA